MATRSFQQQAAVGLSFSASSWFAASKPPCLVRSLVRAADHGDAPVTERDQMVGGKRGAVGIVAAEHGHMRALDIARDQHGRQAVILGHADVARGRIDGRGHDHAIGAELQQRVDEGALLVQLVIVVGQQEGLARAIQLMFDGAQDFRIERIHDVVDDDAHDARAGGPQRRCAPIVDITDLARMFLDAFAGRSGHQRTVAKCERHRCRRHAKRISDRGKLDLLSQRYCSPPHLNFLNAAYAIVAGQVKAFSPRPRLLRRESPGSAPATGAPDALYRDRLPR